MEVRFISPKLAQIFVRSKLELLNTYGIVAPRSFEYFQTGSYITAANITVPIDTETSGQPKKIPKIATQDLQQKLKLDSQVHKKVL